MNKAYLSFHLFSLVTQTELSEEPIELIKAITLWEKKHSYKESETESESESKDEESEVRPKKLSEVRPKTFIEVTQTKEALEKKVLSSKSKIKEVSTTTC